MSEELDAPVQIPPPTLRSIWLDLQRSFFGEPRLPAPPPDFSDLKLRPGEQPPQQQQRQACFSMADLWNDLYFPLHDKIKLVGLLFMHPESAIAKNDVLPRFGWYHQRSGEFTQFFFSGYGANGEWNSLYPDQRVAIDLDGTQWLFSDRAFNEFRHELESKTSWTYSGETDLLLSTARFFPYPWNPERGEGNMDFSQCITCCLEELVRAEAIASVPRFFERIFHFSETRQNATAYDFSDLHLMRTSKISLLEWVLSRFGLKEYFNRNRGTAIRDISKRT